MFALVTFSFFLSLVLVTPLSAQGESVLIISGKDTAFNIDLAGDLPLKEYESSPPVMIAAQVDSGAVVAAGTAGTCRNEHWNNPDNPYPYFDKLLDIAFKWMVPGATDVLWYEGYGVYNVASECENLIDALESLGYSVTGDDTEPIADINLAPYDILVIPQMQLGAPMTGGDPSLLPNADVQAIVNFVEGGGGLLIMEQADYNGLNFGKVHNKILEALGLNIRFQDDQVQDDTNKWGGQIYQPITDVDTMMDIGSAYESATGESEIGLDSLCSLRIVKDYDVTVRIEPSLKSGEAGETLTYEGEIINIGTESDTYTITVEDELGWSPSVSPGEISLDNGASGEVEIEVTVPVGLTGKVVNWITLKAVGVSGAEDNARSRAMNVSPENEPPYPIAHPEKKYFWFSVCSQLVELPAVPIMTGIETGYSTDLTPREPEPILYGKGEFPVAAAAALVGDGRLITAGPACLRSSPVDWYTNEMVASREFAPLWPQWLIDWGDPREHKLLYYVNDPNVYTDIFNDCSKVPTWLDDLREIGFEVACQEGGEITSELIEDYDVLQIAELKRSFTANEKQAIVDWVNGGGGLLLMSQADYAGYAAPKYPNEVLEALDVPITFQDDEIYDDDSWTADGPHFPEVYLLDPREVNSKFDVWFPRHNPIIVSLKPAVISAKGKSVAYKLTVKNGGTAGSTFGIEVEETTPEPLGWAFEVKPEVELAAGGTTEVYIKLTIPEVESTSRVDLEVKFRDKEAAYLTDSKGFAALGDPSWVPAQAEFKIGGTVSHENLGKCTVQNNEYGWNGNNWVYSLKTADGAIAYAPEDELSLSSPPSEFPWEIIVAAIVVIVVIVVIGYWAKKR